MGELYAANSHRSKEENAAKITEKKKVEKVVKGKAVKKKNNVRKLAGNFINEDIANVKTYIFSDILLPAAKKTISDMVTNGVDMILYGESGHRKSKSAADRVSYRNYYDRDRRDRDDDRDRKRRTGYSHDDIVLDSRGEANDVLERMDELIDTYGFVSVADMYDLVGLSGSYTDNKYGWTNLRNADVIRVRDGYLLKMPKAFPID